MAKTIICSLALLLSFAARGLAQSPVQSTALTKKISDDKTLQSKAMYQKDEPVPKPDEISPSEAAPAPLPNSENINEKIPGELKLLNKPPLEPKPVKPPVLPTGTSSHKATPRAPLSPYTFEVNLPKFAKSIKPLNISEISERQIRASRYPATRMKWFEMQGDWKACSDMREKTLKASPTLAGWIWIVAFNCELKLFDSIDRSQGHDKSSTKKKNAVLNKTKRLQAFQSQFQNHLELLDSGPWQKDLQSYWLKTLTLLNSQAQSPLEKAKVADSFYLRPEFISGEVEKEILNDLQAPFEATQSSSNKSLRPVPAMTEPWWEPARKMDYESVVKLLEEYFNKNKSPSNILSASLLLAKAYLWTGRYEQAKTAFQKLGDDYPLTEEGLEAQFRLGLLHLRLGNPQFSIQTFDKLLASGREKNSLTTRYWRLRALQVVGPHETFEAERGQLINEYPFTYFGLKLRIEAQQGRLEFPEIAVPSTRATWVFPKTAESRWKRFSELLKVGFLWEAGAEIQEVLSLGDAEAYQMWAEFFSSVKLDYLAMKYGQMAQNLNDQLVAWSFQKKFMPFAFEKIVQDQASTHKIEPWIIWAVMRQESAFNIRAQSSSSAYGLMQLIGPTAQEVAQDLKVTVSLPEDLFVPERNIPFGARYLSKMKNEFGGHWPLAIASYNAGPTRLKAWLKLRKDTEGLTASRSTEWRDEIWIDELPWNETQNYVKSVMRNFILYRLGNQGYWTPPPVFWSDSDPSQGLSGRRLIEKKSIKR
jgi:soluble lytic murein transglycosylase-like protein/TolA-binding protein